MSRVNVTKTFLPPYEEYEAYVRRIWESGQLTNQGPLLQELESRLQTYLNVPKLHFVGNGTIALQLAIRALDITEGEIITTPFSYVATTSAILWERCEPVYVDIDPEFFTMDPDKIEAAITDRTRAIMPVHVFGVPCDVERIEQIAAKYNLPVIYDAAHAFGVTYKGKSLLGYGDISTCSFHATKLFHTVEGGAIIAKDPKVSEKVELMKRFGHNFDEHVMLGVNAKANEFQAAMGLSTLAHIDEIIASRKKIADMYDALLGNKIQRLALREGTVHNYIYYPIVFQSSAALTKAMEALQAQDIYPRRYFYPSLNKLPYVPKGASCPISEEVTDTILSLPLYADMDQGVVEKISNIVSRFAVDDNGKV